MLDARELIRSLPEQPGVYRMLDAGEVALYVGKAKNLRKRVSSYFQRTQPSPRIARMVSLIVQVEVTVTRSETEALLLENNLIKTLAPRFNILFRDDKSYPYIKLSGDPFPQLSFHRGAFEKGARYFGPFPNAQSVRESIQLLQRVFQLRTCENPVFNNRSRPCLLHQIKRCSAPCVGRIGAAEYAADVRMARLLLRGQPSEVVERLTQRMQAASQELGFEQAAVYRDQIRSLQNVLHRQFVASDRDVDADVVAVVRKEGIACVNLAMVRGGLHLGDRSHVPSHAEQSTAEETLAAFIEQHYADHPPPTRVVVNVEAGDEDMELASRFLAERRCTLSAPRNEAERVWMEMAERNALLAVGAHLRGRVRSEQRLDALAEALGMGETPRRIECFDISHTMGEATVASCVVFAGGELRRAEYRRYNISGIEPGDDYGGMRQALTRRYEKVASGEGVVPDLVLVDGGKGQLGVALEVLADLGLDQVPLVGVAKGEGRKPGLEELVLPDGRPPLRLGVESPALQLVQEIRDEAHRFAITGHRQRRARARTVSRLEDIPGIGPERRRRLLAQLGGMQGVKAATVEDLCRVSGISRKLAEQIYSGLR
ncbi:MAG: excinuclease ABC subunit UvrC [Betaproteobacteria bacterium]|nr:excinuclease ABC subunit UvrC [Betaproteobacteria bacterium]